MNPGYRKFLGWCRTLHVYLTMFALLLILFFAGTGFMLNHESWFGLDSTHTTTATVQLPEDLLKNPAGKRLEIVEFLRAQPGVSGMMASFEPTEIKPQDEELRITFKGPGKVTDAVIQLPSGKIDLNFERHGVLGIMTDLHKSTDAGESWKRLVDVTAITLILGSLTGLVLFLSLPKRRKLGFTVLGLGTACGILLYIFIVP